MDSVPVATAVADRPSSLSAQTLHPKAGDPKGKTWASAAGQREAAVNLAALPAGVEFPDEFPEPIQFDAARKKLMYRGQMYHSSYLFLLSFSKHAAYDHAIDELFAASVPPANEGRSLPWGMIALGGIVAVIAAGFGIWLML